ncbi:S41 family peptidase [Sphingomonas sp. ERG5]|uniref:S41 family peptidase n=1 Tax=Sphingomonas sp. ERG5 TaxID=1381597 RepID=UPI000691DD0D|nr:S41 family peptidase [Sphingomonas sp. ERG5]
MRVKTLWAAATSIVALVASTAAYADEARLMRYPDIAGDRITFVYGDKLWVADATGANAREVPSTGTQLSRPHFSPDGKRIAFSANIDGNVDVYVVSIGETAAPRRLTHHPATDLVVDWDPSGRNVLFASTMTSPRATYDQLQLVPADGGLPVRVPLPYGETATYTEDGGKLLFTYKRDFQEEAWKRYYGGRAPDIWSFDLKTGQTTQLTNSQASDSMPMRVNGRTYFLSERDDAGRSNIWALDARAGAPVELTHFVDTDVRRPATDGKRIIYEVDGRLEILDPASGKTLPVHITIDRAKVAPPAKPIPVGDRMVNAALSNDGGVVLEARGDVFAYDAAGTAVVDLTPDTSGSAERFPRPNANGDIAFLSDRGGEYALYVRAKKDGSVRKIADFGPGLRYSPFWSPDGRLIALYDYEEVLWLVDVSTGEKTRIDQGKWWYHTELLDQRVAWSPDGRWIAYSRGLENRNNAIFLYDVRAHQRHQVTSGAFNDFGPVFDSSGNYLLALSSRKFDPTFGDGNIDNTWTYAPNTVVSVLPLMTTGRAPGRPDWSMPATRQAVDIDFDGLESRLALLEARPGDLNRLQAVPGGFVVLRQGSGPDAKNVLERYRLGKSDGKPLQTETGLALADGDGVRLLTRVDTKLSVIDLSDDTPRKLDDNKLVATVDRRAEYQQMFNDAWRYGRDFYYDPGMNGADWVAARKKLGALVPYAVIDDDETFIVRELMGELNGGHVYASATAPRPRSDAQTVGMLGVDFEAAGGRYRIAKIYRTGSRAYDVRSPLDDPSLGVHEGDVLLSVNGKQLDTGTDPWAAFIGLAGKDVKLEFAAGSADGQKREITVKTLTSERKLRELAWVEENRKKVDAASGGRVGYIYVPNTGAEGQNELMIQYRSQFAKDALIVDERFNTGGALGDRMIELLNRPPLVMFRARNSSDYPLPELAHRGPKAMLSNGWSYSGGDGFPLLFKTAKLGPLIGTRTWGGLIGPALSLPLINGGFISAAPQRVYRIDGQWAEGNEGVHPTVEVDNNPGELARGVDTQLDTAIRMMVGAIKPLRPITPPPFQKPGDWNPAKREKK